jgi:hypothetical protein
MEGGTITGNTTTKQVIVRVKSGGSFNMSGGTIAGNTASGSPSYTVNVEASAASFNMNGGTISGNETTFDVSVDGGGAIFKKTGGVIGKLNRE